MWERILERFFVSVADATFWILIIVAIGFILNWICKRIITFLTEEIIEKKEQ